MSLIKRISRNTAAWTAALALALVASVATTNPVAAAIDKKGPSINAGPTGEEMKCSDFDADGEVGSADLAALLGEFGRCRDCEYDINDDGVVNRRDVDLLMEQWGSTDCATAHEAEICESDLDGDGVIDNGDLAMVLGNYGACPESEADLNDDGVVDKSDSDLLIEMWGSSDCSEPTAASCRADFDDDGVIGPYDLAVVLGAYGDVCAADFNGDGKVGEEDVDILLDRWGTQCED